MDSFCVHMPATAPAPAGVPAQMADAAAGHDGAKLRRALVGGGAAKAAAALLLALLLALSRPPAGGVFLRGGTAPLCAYYAALAAVALFGGLEVSVGFWVAARADPDGRRRGWGRRVLWVSVVPLVVVAGLGGFAVLK